MPNSRTIQPGMFRRKPLVMVTGATGFIGHNVMLDLLEWTDWNFIATDVRGFYSAVPERLLNDPRYDPERVEFVSVDLRTPFFEAIDDMHWKRVLPHPYLGDGKPLEYPDFILNIASNSHVDASITDPVPFVESNVSIILNTLEFARVAKPKLFVQFSTDEVYGAAPDGTDFREWDPYLPSNPYAASKAAQESIAISYWRTYGVPLLITNTMNVIGPGQHEEKFVPMAIDRLERSLPMTVHAEAVVDHDHRRCDDCRHQTPGHERVQWEAGSRYYIYVSNVSSALKFLVERSLERGVHVYPDHDRPEKFHIVGEEEIRNDEMVRRLAELLGVPAKMDYVDFHASRPGHDRRYALDGTALAEAGWVPPVSLEEGLRRVVEASKPKPVYQVTGPFAWDESIERMI